MANQLAIKLLNGNNTKVIVPDNSHVFRDEADAAQSVHKLRLIPLGKNKAYFNLNDVKNAIKYLDENEVFKSGLGTVMIENPIRRADGTIIPLKTIVEITEYCREQGYKLHLDGARGWMCERGTANIVIKDANDLCMYLIEEAHVAIVSGDAFGDLDNLQ